MKRTLGKEAIPDWATRHRLVEDGAQRFDSRVAAVDGGCCFVSRVLPRDSRSTGSSRKLVRWSGEARCHRPGRTYGEPVVCNAAPIVKLANGVNPTVV